MSTGVRIFVCLLAGLITFIVLAIIGFKSNNMGAMIGVAIGLTALITKNYRNDS